MASRSSPSEETPEPGAGTDPAHTWDDLVAGRWLLDVQSGRRYSISKVRKVDCLLCPEGGDLDTDGFIVPRAKPFEAELAAGRVEIASVAGVLPDPTEDDERAESDQERPDGDAGGED